MRQIALAALLVLPFWAPHSAMAATSGTGYARGQAPVEVLSQGSTSHRALALTFDAGADRGYAASILSTLERYHIHASFGMTGLWAAANPGLLRRMVRDGDVIINHTYDHRSFTGYSTQMGPLSVQQRTWEIRRAEQVIRSIAGVPVKPYFRPPFGDYDAATLSLLRSLGYGYMVMWTLDSEGWEHLAASAILRRCLAGVHPGTILIMHVGSQSQDALALPALIRGLKQRGYRFETVSTLATQR